MRRPVMYSSRVAKVFLLTLLLASGCGRAREKQEQAQAQWLPEAISGLEKAPAKEGDAFVPIGQPPLNLPEPATPLEKAVREYILVMNDYLPPLEAVQDPRSARAAVAEVRKLNPRFDALVPLFAAANVWHRPGSSLDTPFKYKEHLNNVNKRERALEKKETPFLLAGALPALIAEEHAREPFGPQRMVDELQRRLPAVLEQRRRERGTPKPSITQDGVPAKTPPGQGLVQMYGKLRVITVRITNEVPKDSMVPLWVVLRTKSGAQQHEAGLVDGVYTVALVAEDMEGFVKKLDIGKVTNVDLVKREITLEVDPAKLPKQQ